MLRTRITYANPINWNDQRKKKKNRAYFHTIIERFRLIYARSRAPSNSSSDALFMNLVLWTCRRRCRQCVRCARVLSMTFARTNSIWTAHSAWHPNRTTGILIQHFPHRFESIHQKGKIQQKIISSMNFDVTWFRHTASSRRPTIAVVYLYKIIIKK